MSLIARLTALAQAVGADIKAINTKIANATKTFDTWHTIGAAGEPAFGAGWSAFGAGEPAPAFRKDINGRVSLRGFIKNGSQGVLFTLPVGYRPTTGNPAWSVMANNGSAYGVAQVYVNAASGEVRASISPFNVVNGASYVVLDVIEFDTDTVSELGVLITGASQVPIPLDTWHQVGAVGEPAFNTASSWQNLDAVGPNQRSLRFTKTPLGRVELTGFVKGANNTSIFTLPAGYRPQRTSVIDYKPASGGYAQIAVNQDGTVVATNIGASSVAAYVSLDGFAFDTETVTVMPAGPQGIQGPTGGIPLTKTLNWNTALVPGFYRSTNDGLEQTINGPGDTLNPPKQAGVVYAHENTSLIQRVWDLDFQIAYSRFRASDGTWSAWIPDLTKAPVYTDIAVGGATPQDGDERYFQNAAMKTAGVIWKFRYDKTNPSLYKWEFVEGKSLYVEVVTSDAITGAAWADLATVGPQSTLPLRGEYDIDFSAAVSHNAGAGVSLGVAVKLGAAAVADPADASHTSSGGASGISNTPIGRSIRRTVTTDGVVVKMQYWGGNATGGNISRRVLRIEPLRVAM